MLTTSEPLARALECLPPTLAELRRRGVDEYVLAAFDTRCEPWSALAASLDARARRREKREEEAAPVFAATGDPVVVAAVLIPDLRAFLADALVPNDDLDALLAWLDRPLVADHIRVLAVSGADVRAGQFRCIAATQRRLRELD